MLQEELDNILLIEQKSLCQGIGKELIAEFILNTVHFELLFSIITWPKKANHEK